MKALLTLVGILSIVVFATACSKQEEVVSPVDEISVTETAETEVEQPLQDGMNEIEESNGMIDDADDSAEVTMEEAEEAMDQEVPEQE